MPPKIVHLSLPNDPQGRKGECPSRVAVKAKTRLQRTRELARAFATLDRAEAAYRAARIDLDRALHPWAAGRSISRDEARQQLESTGHLPERKI